MVQEAAAEANHAKGDDIDEAGAKLASAYEECMAAAQPILEKIDGKMSDFKMENNLEFLQCLVINHATPVKLADYCREGNDKVERLMNLLKNDMELLKQFILAGGAEDGYYGKALDILGEIKGQQAEDKTILSKLAVACALELCSPLQEFDTPGIFVDPVKRYKHYEQAYLNGELDEYFVSDEIMQGPLSSFRWLLELGSSHLVFFFKETMSIQNLRMVVNSDAPDAQLAWGRQMLRDYHPDHVMWEAHEWRYNKICPTDVKYNRPVWTKQPRDYMQILSGGGLCGPRAWFARFICKAHGIPTWGIRVPGHASCMLFVLSNAFMYARMSDDKNACYLSNFCLFSFVPFRFHLHTLYLTFGALINDEQTVSGNLKDGGILSEKRGGTDTGMIAGTYSV